MSQQQQRTKTLAQIIYLNPSITVQQLIDQYLKIILPPDRLQQRIAQAQSLQNWLDDPYLDKHFLSQLANNVQINKITYTVQKLIKMEKRQLKSSNQIENQFFSQNQQKFPISNQYQQAQQQYFQDKNIYNINQQQKKGLYQIAKYTRQIQPSNQKVSGQIKDEIKVQQKLQKISIPIQKIYISNNANKNLNTQIEKYPNFSQEKKELIQLISHKNYDKNPKVQLKTLQKKKQKNQKQEHSKDFSKDQKQYHQIKEKSSQKPKPKPEQKQQKFWKPKQNSRPAKQTFDFQDGNGSQKPEMMPNFQNEEELQKLQNDQKNHKNLFDERGFELVYEPEILKKSEFFYSKQFDNLKQKINRYLIVAYYQYVLEANIYQTIFDKEQIFRKPLMDLTLFLKFFKDFDLKELLKVNDMTKIFKKDAINRLWIDVNKFLQICYQIVQNKSSDNGKESVYVNSEEELIERANKFLTVFDKEKIRKHLKIASKDVWNKILDDYKNKDADLTIGKMIGDKSKVVGKFLERNFDLELPKWYQKKELHQQNSPKQKAKPESNLKAWKQSRDQKSISTNIQKLKSKSEKNLNVLKSLFNQKFDDELKTLIADRSSRPKHQQVQIESPSSKAKKFSLHKKKQKNTISAYKEIEQFINQNMKIMKSQKNLLGKELKIKQEEPFLNAYFNRQQKSNGPKIINKNQVSLEKKLYLIKKSIQLQKAGMTDKLPLVRPSHPMKKFSAQDKIQIYGKSNIRNQFASQNKFDNMRKKNSNSSPSDSAVKVTSPKRVHSMKKLVQNSISKNKLSPTMKLKDFNNQKNKIVNSRPILNDQQTQLINKKLFQFLLSNKEQNLGVLNPQKDNRIKSLLEIKSSKTEGQQNILMKNYRQEVYELFKNISKRGKQEQSIVIYQNQKRKGYIKNQQQKKLLL